MEKSSKIIFDNQDLLVISKKAGISFHGEQGDEGFFAQVRRQLGGATIYPVHRLDKITSGLLIIAKNKESAQHLSEMFREKSIEKYYLAISDQKPKKKQGLISGDMETSRRGTWKLLKMRQSPAVTQFFSQSMGGGKRLYLLKPHTGKTHQIRVAMKSIGAAVLGDPLYNKKSLELHDRAYLHAYSIRFLWKNEYITLRDCPESGDHFSSTECTNIIEGGYQSPSSLSWPKISFVSPTNLPGNGR